MTDQLNEQESWRLLATEPVGRLVVNHDGFPSIYPVNYVIEDEVIWFRTASGSKFTGLQNEPNVGFQVESITGDTGWSINVRGTAEHVPGDETIKRVEELGLNPWVEGEKPFVVRVTPREITGRRFAFRRSERVYG